MESRCDSWIIAFLRKMEQHEPIARVDEPGCFGALLVGKVAVSAHDTLFQKRRPG